MQALQLNSEQQQQLLDLARWAIASRLGEVIEQPRVNLPDETVACFVTLHKGGQLRGCIGCLEPQYPLVQGVINYARAAAFDDPRFPEVRLDELDKIELDISILSPLESVSAQRADLIESLRPGVDGVVLESGGRRATFLPQVWQELPAVELFLKHLLRKGGWSHWPPEAKAYRYQVVHYQDD
ncbi:AmmeMemoRadiSam system protein A [Dongshaea marina]|uniref:AmmeMemoRadiSam system protein A n=1 Tax=Dongshaea marina TaxID=2047966 RepID=UPI00131EE92E|nr:AmmeMemoRadiSam system protein A [Dongshaea marina]